MNLASPADLATTSRPDSAAPTNEDWLQFKPVALEDETYRWTIGIHARPAQHAVAEEFATGFRTAWPGRTEMLSIVRFPVSDDPVAGHYNELSETACDLLFVIDDPASPDDVAELLTAAINARHTPILVSEPASTTAPSSRPVLSWSIAPGLAKEHAAAFALAVFGAVLPKGPICVDWQDLLMLLDAPRQRLQIVHCAGKNSDDLSRAFAAAPFGAGRQVEVAGSRPQAHTTFIHNGSLRMVQLRALVTEQRQQLGEDGWLSYAAPIFACDQFHAFTLLFAEHPASPRAGSHNEPYQRRQSFASESPGAIPLIAYTQRSCRPLEAVTERPQRGCSQAQEVVNLSGVFLSRGNAQDTGRR